MRGSPPRRNIKKPKTAVRLKRYKCAICRKKSGQATAAPYYCPKCSGVNNPIDWNWDYPE